MSHQGAPVPPGADAAPIVAWLRETMDAAAKGAQAAAERAWSPHWEYDEFVREIRDMNNAGTLATIYYPEIGNFTAANDPASVLRRIAADRKTLDLHSQAHECVSYDSVTKDINTCMWIDTGDACTTIYNLAEGWGWTAT